jgi:Bacterial regulatory proteins, luxR family
VLALVAAGRSNRQIAQALFISPKTVGVHVSNILAKLGVAGRVRPPRSPTAWAWTDGGQRHAVVAALAGVAEFADYWGWWRSCGGG